MDKLFRAFCIMLPPAIIMILTTFTILNWGENSALREKVGQLEDCVFNGKGCYNKEVRNG